jgi:hypothetical protein
MSFDKAKDALKMLEVVLHGLETIQTLTKIGGDKAHQALDTIGAVIDGLIDGFNGKADAKTVEEAIKSLKDKLASNDAAADAALHKKFDHGGVP